MKTIMSLLETYAERDFPLLYKELRLFWIIQEVYRQQKQMYDNNTHKVSDRIVSMSQPHVRPIVRGKTNKEVEFGAKISASLINGYVFLDRVSWDAYNESEDLIEQVEGYKDRFGFYPESVAADQVYGTRKNRSYLKSKGIGYSFKPLGRPRKNGPEINFNKNQYKELQSLRNQIEGKFGEGKRGYQLNCVMAKTPRTSESWIAAVFFVMNLARWLREDFFVFLFKPVFLCYFKFWIVIKEQYSIKYAF